MKILLKNGTTAETNFEKQDGRQAFWLTSAHVLAHAVKKLYPETKCAAVLVSEHGFSYDFDFPFSFSAEHLHTVEEEMQQLIKKSLSVQVYELEKETARSYLESRNEDYQLELLQDTAAGETAVFYKQGGYAQLCDEAQLTNICQIKAFRLLSIAGAYWKGSEQGKMLTRIYGISFPKASMLEDYLRMQEEAKLRDHRKLGKELGIFTLSEEGPGFPFFLPNGMVLKNLLLNDWRTMHIQEGYQEISTPVMLERHLWEISGHWEHYRENMYLSQADGIEYAVKPMSCPGAMLIYKQSPRSYRSLPMRLAELGLVHRLEKSGQLHGLMRVREFTQDDAHIFMTPAQMSDEIRNVISLTDRMYKKFGFAYHVELSTQPENSIGSTKEWELAQNALRNAIESMGIPYSVNEGDGAFYGPKLDFHLKDSIGRTWQCGTIQLDFQLPQRFHAEYTGADGQTHRPVMIHRAIYGSVERFIGILIEHYAGKFPMWLSPVQIKLLSVSDSCLPYIQEITECLQTARFRVHTDTRNEKLGYKIREARMDRVPFILIAGEKEAAERTVCLRRRDAEADEPNETISFCELVKYLNHELLQSQSY